MINTQYTCSVVLLKSCSIVVLFLVTWALGLVAIYLRDESYGVYLQYPFAIFYAIFGITVSIILCVNKQVSLSFLFFFLLHSTGSSLLFYKLHIFFLYL